MAGKARVAVLFGGRSGEHEVSLRSAASILRAMDRDKYEPVAVGISREGTWVLSPGGGVPERGYVSGDDGPEVFLVGGRGGPRLIVGPGRAAEAGSGRAAIAVDVVFPVLHGPQGEDGTLQGLLEMAGVPYVGSGVLASAVGMDKGFMKDLFRQKGIPTVDYLVVKRRDWEADHGRVAREIGAALGYPCFVKPANLGSSVGISKVADEGGLAAAMDLAARYDRRIVVEAGVSARELECAVLGNDDPRASAPGEIVPSREFYDYEAKYVDDRSELLIPAPLGEGEAERVRDLAARAFLALDCSGMARVDFFLERGSGRLFVNEINTIPGFTSISMYPKLWEASGVSYPELIDRLIALARERWREGNRDWAKGRNS